MSSSTFLPTIIIMSASSSMMTTMNGIGCSSGAVSLEAHPGMNVGSSSGLPLSIASLTLLL